MAPPVINVLGLKKSGKTTVVEGVIASLRARGYAVGSVKSMVRSSFSFDVEGKDTRRHSKAGADFVLSLSKGETVYLEVNKGGRRRLSEVSRLFPERVQIIVCEGLEDPEADQVQVCCLRELDDMDETLRVRGIRKNAVVAISGLVASKAPQSTEIPVFDVTVPSSREMLVDLLLESVGSPRPNNPPGGPLAENPEWRPGVLPPGEYPDIPEETHH